MKVKTVGMLAGAAMMLSSVTVWSITPEGGFSSRIDAQIEGAAITVADPLAQLESWKFAAGTTLTIEGRLGHSTLASSRDNETFLFVDVKAPPDAVQSTSAPLNLAVVVDRSGSMRGKRLDNAIEAARTMVRRLRDGDVVSVITYDTATQTLVPATTIDSTSRQEVVSRIGDITLGGDTCISCGIDEAMSALRGRDGMVKRVLLLSDGEATAGVRDVEGFRRLAARAREMDCAITSIGVDVDYNERIMSALALESNGRHYFVEEASGLARIFDQEVQSLIKTVATSAELRVDLEPGVEVVQVFDRAFRREGNTLVVPMGSFTAADQKTLLVKVRMPRGAVGARPVASVRFDYEDLVRGGRGQATGALLASLTSDPADVSPLDPIVGARLGRAETASALKDANALFASGDLEAARARLAEKRADLARRKTVLRRAAPKPRKAELERDFDRQLAALDEAEEGFASPPAAEAAPQASRPGKAQVRRNASQATELGF